MAKKKGSKSSSRASDSLPPPPAIDQDDSGLLDDLVAHLDSRNAPDETKVEAAEVIRDMNQSLSPPAAQVESSSKSSSKQRFEARKMRKAAELAAQYTEDDKEATALLEKEAQDEEAAIMKLCHDLHVEMFDIRPDGHCLFSAIADQLACLGILLPADAHYKTTRLAASLYIFQHRDDFLPFLPSIDGEDGAGATDAGLMTPQSFERYCAQIRDTAIWGGEPEILALSRAYNTPIHIVQYGQPPVVVHEPGTPHNGGVIRISYHRRMYGLGEHYNSLRPKPSFVQQVKDIIHP